MFVFSNFIHIYLVFEVAPFMLVLQLHTSQFLLHALLTNKPFRFTAPLNSLCNCISGFCCCNNVFSFRCMFLCGCTCLLNTYSIFSVFEIISPLSAAQKLLWTQRIQRDLSCASQKVVETKNITSFSTLTTATNAICQYRCNLGAMFVQHMLSQEHNMLVASTSACSQSWSCACFLN